MIESLASGTTSSLVAKNVTKKLSLPFEELQGSNSELKLITPKPITGTYYETKLSRYGLAGLPMVAILDLKIPLSHLLEELRSINLEY